MGLFGDMLDAAKHVGSEIAHAVQSGGERLGNVLTGAGVGLLAGGVSAIRGPGRQGRLAARAGVADTVLTNLKARA